MKERNTWLLRIEGEKLGVKKLVEIKKKQKNVPLFETFSCIGSHCRPQTPTARMPLFAEFQQKTCPKHVRDARMSSVGPAAANAVPVRPARVHPLPARQVPPQHPSRRPRNSDDAAEK